MNNLGFGVGLRPTHYPEIFEARPDIDWFEIISENFFVRGGRPLHNLERIRRDYPVVMHGVSLSIGGAGALDPEYLRELKRLADRIEPAGVSDHLCWTGAHGTNLHDLLPLPYTQEAVSHVAARVREVQDSLQRQILLENVSSYVTFRDSTMTEWEFLAEISVQSDCRILLDINNVFVSAHNHGFDPAEYIDAMPAGRVAQFHLAGHEDNGTILIDTHDAPVPPGVWALYERAVRRFPGVPTMIERDDRIPPLAELLAELDQARRISAEVARREAA